MSKLLLFYFLIASVASFFASAGVIEDIEQHLENKRMHSLESVKHNIIIKPFTSDGCSGGLSTGWEYLADKFPLFYTRYGQKPPWHQCCVEHDKAYWQGETQHGFQKRKSADLLLKKCVIDLGVKIAGDLPKSQSLNKTEIEFSFALAGELMYRAVRIGGQPCSPFAWRWGYGWPKCTFK